MKWLEDSKETILGIIGMIAIGAFIVWGMNGFGNGNDKGSAATEELKTASITLVDGISEQTITVTYNEEYRTSVPNKSGFYFKGYYDSETGGDCYIGANGKSIGVWTEVFPTKLYAQYGSIEGMSWTSDVENADEAYKFSFYSVIYDFKLPNDFQNAMKANPGKKIKVVLNFKAKQLSEGTLESPHRMNVKLQDGSDKGAMSFGKYELMAGKEYQSYTYEYTANAASFPKGILYISFDLGYANTSMYLRDISIDVSFVD